MTNEQIEAARAETERLCHELDIANADHVALWLETNMPGASLAWLACRIVEAHEAALSAQQAAGEAEAWICDGLPDEMIEAGIDAWERARDEMRAREESDQPEKHNDWDEGMIVAAIYKAMTLYATPQPTETQRIVAWQPIETAPKDGTHILLLWSYDNGTGPRVSEAFWRNDMPFVNDGCWWFFHGRMFQEPTHWMPLPEAPASGEHLAGERE